jgi:hypothetical protein
MKKRPLKVSHVRKRSSVDDAGHGNHALLNALFGSFGENS